ncbi:hypothetical protein GH714_011418 [Hevea brasiliensis]|uniref:Uncharacterized protein n=1 Tax=Hevea brasiliensis TaxID=3981 RepID=A0A6A6MIH6_HEVBR|nr:hypothetical protein GH714_011418 [Hevea brasiliensis]
MNANDKNVEFHEEVQYEGVEANISVNPASGFNEEYNIGSNATTGGNEKVNIGENESTGMGADIEVKNDDNVLDEVDISEEKEEDNSAGDSDNEDSICEGLDANLIEGSDEDEDEELRVAREKVKSTKEGNLRELKKRMYLKYNLGQLKMMQDMKVMIGMQEDLGIDSGEGWTIVIDMHKPIRGRKLWLESDHPYLQPPQITTLPGRLKKNRRRDKDEPKKKYGKLGRFGMQMICRLCNQVGHNKKKKKKKTYAMRNSVGNEGNWFGKESGSNKGIGFGRGISSGRVVGSGKGIGSGRGSYSRKGIGSGRGSGSDVTDGVGMSSESSIRRGKLPNFGATTSSSQVKVRKTTGYGCYVNLYIGKTIENVS